jgi:hypothetical protein
VYSPKTGLFYIAVPQNGPNDTGGVVAVVDPRGDSAAMQVVSLIPLQGCGPNGAALGPGYELYLGCTSGSIPGSQIIDIRDGSLIARFSQAAGCDQVNYNSGDNHFLGDCGGLAIIDADPPSFDQKIVGAAHAGTAADPVTNQVYAAVTANGAPCGGTTNNGCIAIYGYPLTQVNVASVPTTTNQPSITLDASGSTSATGTLSYLFTVVPGGNTPTITQSPTNSKATVLFNGGPGTYLLQVIVVDGAGNTSTSPVITVLYTGQ